MNQQRELSGLSEADMARLQQEMSGMTNDDFHARVNAALHGSPSPYRHTPVATPDHEDYIQGWFHCFLFVAGVGTLIAFLVWR